MSLLLGFTVLIFAIYLGERQWMRTKKYSGPLLSENLESDIPVDESFFWKTIDRTNTNDLVDALDKLSAQELNTFLNTYFFLLNQSYTADLWEKAYAINMGCSDDCFEYFREWLISQGKDKFYLSLHDPSYLRFFAKKEMMENYQCLFLPLYDVLMAKGLPVKMDERITRLEIHDYSQIERITLPNVLLGLVTWLN